MNLVPITSERPFQARSGFALPGVLLVLALLFTVSVPAILMMEQEWKITEAVVESAEAQAVVEDGLVDLLAVWDSSFFALAVWDDTTVTTSSSGGVVDVRVTRTSPQLFLLEATGVSDEGHITVKSALTVRAGAAQVAPGAALTTLTAGLTGATVRGWDEPPSTWTCSGSLEQPYGVVVPDASALVVGPGGSVYGYPPIQVDSTLVSGIIVQPADVHFKTLASMADVVHPGGFS
ncbi:MAG: hypothetical protein OEO23_13190, partial [Gemmatimonadota bacterium]|nr:hypothetical protein [Gemmatimonadota bacterium]